MKKYSYKFLVIDDDLNVCESVEKRMGKFNHWKCYGKIASLKEAKEVTQKELPELLFLDNFQSKIHVIEAPVVEISSTFIRNSIKEKKNITPMLPEKVAEYIEHNLFYTK